LVSFNRISALNKIEGKCQYNECHIIYNNCKNNINEKFTNIIFKILEENVRKAFLKKLKQKCDFETAKTKFL
jgi:hypothetical protein